MPAELDHFFILVDVGAPEAEALIRFGLTEGSPNRHPGQGTANRRFFFHNAFLELVWVDDAAAAQSAATRRTGLWQRWSRRREQASPLGVGFRPQAGETCEPPFTTWDYRPAYLPAPLAIQMGTNSERPDEPLLFFLAFGRPADAADSVRRQPLEHRANLQQVTRLRVVTTLREAPSEQLLAAQAAGAGVEFATGDGHLLEVGFDFERLGKSHDFRPVLPLVFHW